MSNQKLIHKQKYEFSLEDCKSYGSIVREQRKKEGLEHG